MKVLAMAMALPCLTVTSRAATVTTSLQWDVVSGYVPDNDPAGWKDLRNVNLDITRIDSLQVHLEIEGGWNGDLFAYIRHGDGFSVLLNRVGTTDENGAGSNQSGFDVTFSDSASRDIHTYSGGIFSGNFMPDARISNPETVTNLSPRTEFLSSFNGLDPNGQWTLFVADMAAMDQARVVSWGITVTQGMAVPEPTSAAAVGLPLLLLGGVVFRRNRKTR
ncbi:PEP-CTERM sorting domain-containing protein [Luteolibacter flavescens]|uniref:PEP-CTERM sorting domain-containing protein n=1 Tax=Luteolibacter flavescens TaxID=1859460 RepID=A0ABT3FJ07_9BACT|nr:PEP-CTERM sorting domain-containing protein [Luteolibacter flavescens]MCW1883266.1 PEP-CTERM sorting domain-containing protein [Luteolibacter flavescens]